MASAALGAIPAVGQSIGIGDRPKIYSPSTLDPRQQFMEGIFSRLFPNLLRQGLGGLGQHPAGWNRALSNQLSGKPQDTAKYFRQGVLNPALRGFDRDIAPRINEGFASQGGSFSSRRGIATQHALSDVYANAQSQLAQQEYSSVEAARNRQLQALGIPLQQQLGQIQGLQGLVSPLLQYLGIPTQELLAGPGNRTQFGQAIGSFGSSLIPGGGGGGGKSGGGGGGGMGFGNGNI